MLLPPAVAASHLWTLKYSSVVDCVVFLNGQPLFALWRSVRDAVVGTQAPLRVIATSTLSPAQLQYLFSMLRALPKMRETDLESRVL